MGRLYSKQGIAMKINLKDTSFGWWGSSSGKSGSFARKQKITECQATLTHKPTGISVRGEIAPGHYSKKEMQTMRKNLQNELLEKLGIEVSKKK